MFQFFSFDLRKSFVIKKSIVYSFFSFFISLLNFVFAFFILFKLNQLANINSTPDATLVHTYLISCIRERYIDRNYQIRIVKTKHLIA